MDFNIDDDRHTIVLESNDLQCPITCETYTHDNYPITLLCGHTLSIKSFNYLKEKQNQTMCPTCRQAFPKEYTPQKTILWANIVQQVQERKGISCEKHFQKRAVGICLEDKRFLCLECLLEDEHPKSKKVSVERLNSYFQQKKDFLKQLCENIQNEKGRNEFGMTKEKAQELIEKLNKVNNSKSATEKIDIFNEVEREIKVVEESEKKIIKKNNKNSFGQKFLSLFKSKKKVPKDLSPNKEVRYLEITLISEVNAIAQIQNKKTCTGLHVKFSELFKDFDGFCSNLSKFPLLTSLTLDLQESKTMNDEFLKKISQCIRELTLLASLDINLAECKEIRDKGMIELSSSISSLKSLKLLKLNLRNCYGINSNAQTSKNSASKPNLDKSGEDPFKIFANHLKEIHSLETLELDFTKCVISDNVLKQISSGLGTLVSLTVLKLSFSRCHVSDNGINEITIGMKNLQRLTSLSLDFSNNSLVTDNAIKQVGSCISNLQLLNNLHLEFSYCYTLSDVGIKDLVNSLKSLKGIQSLQLGFIGYNSISDTGAEAVRQWVKAQTTLVALQLQFENCCVSSQGLQELKNLMRKYQTILTITNVK